MNNLYNHKIINAGELIGTYFIDARTLFLQSYNQLPNQSYIGQIDGLKAFEAFKKKFGEQIDRIYENRNYDSSSKKYECSTILVQMKYDCLLEFDYCSCEIFHLKDQTELVTLFTREAASFRERRRRKPLEINMVVRNRYGLSLKSMAIKRRRLDLGLFYGEAFKETDALIRKRLQKRDDKGIVLLHGLPGSGKTTYLRYLIGKLKKRILFLSPSVAGSVTDPEFIELLINNQNTILVVEDAENIIMDRRHNHSSSVSTLLNISDGLLADFLNVQLICTFNSALTTIDSALLRKGRLIARHEFGRLEIPHAQRLSNHLGFDTVISKPMTVAEITNQHEKQEEQPEARVIGFRR
ncbi:MAG: ATP-binding protein [Bacteroidetes bacterium]|nr:ATP-binding protein [Bacteroidota bacterium]